MDWPMRTSAKDVVSVPAFVVIGYECTILFGAIATLLAMFHFCRLPDILRKVGYDPRFSDDKFGVVVSCGGEEVDTVVESLKRAGADEVEVRDAL
jgi:molybdopterin-containing oxidoreductase family membrane subunit